MGVMNHFRELDLRSSVKIEPQQEETPFMKISTSPVTGRITELRIAKLERTVPQE